MKRYTKEDVNFLTNNYGKLSNKIISQKLERTEASIIDKAVSLKLCKKRVNKKGNNIDRVCVVCKITYPKTEEYFTTFVSKRDNRVWSSKCKQCNKSHIEIRNSEEKRYIKSLIKGIFRDKKRISKGFNIDFDYLYNLYIDQDKKCKLTGIPMTTFKGKGLLFSNVSVDRIDSTKGYIQGNVQLVCLWANHSKSSLSTDKFNEMITLAYKHINNER